ncbi:MAG: ArsR family transcriptional regulator, partial [Desulfohalobiaceae bacterium]|nr:ArsR family transcriptional regulator [Desulfohalobiaceae bacterium]
MPQSTVSRHLSYLKNARWIQSKRKGSWMYYRIVRSESALQQKLWSMLDRYLQQLPEVRNDLRMLRIYLEQRRPRSA